MAEEEAAGGRCRRGDADDAPRDERGEEIVEAVDCVDPESVDDEHLAELPDGSGCVEVWEHLADRRGDEE